MVAKCLQLIGLSVLLATVSVNVARPQNFNTSLPLTLPLRAEAPISPATPGTGPGSLTNETAGTNPLTGLPCSGQGALAVSGAGALADAASAPTGDSVAPGGPNAIAEPSLTSVFGTGSALGAC